MYNYEAGFSACDNATVYVGLRHPEVLWGASLGIGLNKVAKSRRSAAWARVT